MTKKDYELIAVAIKNALLSDISFPSEGHNDSVRRVADRIGAGLQDQNHRFDPNKWEVACGFKD